MIINTTDDFIKALRENEEFLAAARREIATQDLLALPDEFDEFKVEFSELKEDVGVLKEDVDVLKVDVGVLKEDVGVLKEDVDVLKVDVGVLKEDVGVLKIDVRELKGEVGEFKEETNRRLDNIDMSILRLTESHRREHEALDRFRGNYANEGAQNNRKRIAKLFADVHGVRRFRLAIPTSEELEDIFDDNLDLIDSLNTEGNVSESFSEGDLIAEVRQRRSQDLLFCLSVEASYTIDLEDVVRASDNAKILRAVTGMDAYAVVAGVRANPELEEKYKQRIIYDLTEFLESDKDDIVLWFQLTDRSLEPSSPR